MPTQRETVESIVAGTAAENIRDPSGMSVVEPGNLGIDVALVSRMNSYRRRLGRSKPWPVLLVRLNGGTILYRNRGRDCHYTHARKVERIVRRLNSDETTQPFVDDEYNEMYHDDGYIWSESSYRSDSEDEIYVPRSI